MWRRAKDWTWEEKSKPINIFLSFLRLLPSIIVRKVSFRHQVSISHFGFSPVNIVSCFYFWLFSHSFPFSTAAINKIGKFFSLLSTNFSFGIDSGWSFLLLRYFASFFIHKQTIEFCLLLILSYFDAQQSTKKRGIFFYSSVNAVNGWRWGKKNSNIFHWKNTRWRRWRGPWRVC